MVPESLWHGFPIVGLCILISDDWQLKNYSMVLGDKGMSHGQPWPSVSDDQAVALSDKECHR